jgi:hypothetical protein
MNVDKQEATKHGGGFLLPDILVLIGSREAKARIIWNGNLQEY